MQRPFAWQRRVSSPGCTATVARRAICNFSWARPRVHRGRGRYIPSRLQSAFELRLREKCACRHETIVGSAQPLEFALQRLQTLPYYAGQAFALSLVSLVALDHSQQRLQHTANSRRDEFDRRPHRGYSPWLAFAMRTARSRISGENTFVLFMEFSQESLPPQKPVPLVLYVLRTGVP